MTDPVSQDPVASDSPENPGGNAAAEQTSAEQQQGGQPPAAEDLGDVDDATADAHAADLGDEVAQPQDHPYDPAADPDAEPKNVVGSAGGPGATLTTDADRPWSGSER